jgi:hypothetical protein
VPDPVRPRAQRAHRIRRTVVAGAVAAFVALWGGLYVQMRAGHDPALGAGAVAQGTTTTTSTSVDAATTATTGDEAAATATTGDDAAATSSDQSAQPSAMTTRSS